METVVSEIWEVGTWFSFCSETNFSLRATAVSPCVIPFPTVVVSLVDNGNADVSLVVSTNFFVFVEVIDNSVVAYVDGIIDEEFVVFVVEVVGISVVVESVVEVVNGSVVEDPVVKAVDGSFGKVVVGFLVEDDGLVVEVVDGSGVDNFSIVFIVGVISSVIGDVFSVLVMKCSLQLWN